MYHLLLDVLWDLFFDLLSHLVGDNDADDDDQSQHNAHMDEELLIRVAMKIFEEFGGTLCKSLI